MSWTDSVIHVVLQPNPNKTLSQIGVFSQNIVLSDQQTAGVCLMLYAIFNSSYADHIRIYLQTGSDPTLYIQNSLPVSLTPSHIEYTPLNYMPKYLILSIDRIIDPLPDEDWDNYIQRLGKLRGRNPNEILMSHTCRMIDRRLGIIYIYQFMQDEFIDGALTLCKWFSLNSDQYIDNIHMGNRLLST